MATTTTGLDKHQLQFIKLIGQTSGAHRPYEVFRDFNEISAITLSNCVDKLQFQAREARYLELVKGYTKDDFHRFAQMLACVIESLQSRYSDCLGQLFMSLELGSHWKGQFFTPYPISLMMAKLLGQGIEGDFESMMEPAVGAGGMVIARAETLQDLGINYQQRLHVTAVDVDITAVHMAYVQFCLLHIPAIVLHGNSLSDERWGHWVTPAHVMGMWDSKLAQKNAAFATSALPAETTNSLTDTAIVGIVKQSARVIEERIAALNQMNLF